jgi:hypothetical protein
MGTFACSGGSSQREGCSGDLSDHSYHQGHPFSQHQDWDDDAGEHGHLGNTVPCSGADEVPWEEDDLGYEVSSASGEEPGLGPGGMDGSAILAGLLEDVLGVAPGTACSLVYDADRPLRELAAQAATWLDSDVVAVQMAMAILECRTLPARGVMDSHGTLHAMSQRLQASVREELTSILDLSRDRADRGRRTAAALDRFRAQLKDEWEMWRHDVDMAGPRST